MALFAKNRSRLLERVKVNEGFDVPTSVIFLEGGKATTRHETDHEDLFRQVRNPSQPSQSFHVSQSILLCFFVCLFEKEITSVTDANST